VIKRLLFIHFSLWTLIGLGQNQVFVDGERFSEWTTSDTLELKNKTEDQIRKFWEKGYLFAGLDSIRQTSIFLHRGARIKLAEVDGGTISFSEVVNHANEQLNTKINSGYPFARLWWDSLRLENGRMKYSMNFDNGPLVTNDSIILLSAIDTKRQFIAQMLGMQKGTLFREKDFGAISDRLTRVSFLTAKRPADISFQNGKSWTYLDLEETSTGSFEGVMGVLPNQSTGGKPLITGNLNLSLLNLFRSGKELDFDWERFGQQSQKLDLRYKHPFIAGSKLHFEGQFGLLRQDTSFIGRMVGLRTSFFIADRVGLGFAFEQSTGDVIATNSARIISNNWLDFQQSSYSISVSSTQGKNSTPVNFTNYDLKFGVGERVISMNPNLPVEQYDTVNLRTTNSELTARFEFQRMMNKRTGIYWNATSAHQSNPQLISNQLYRLGGLKTLRGFNEEFFFAASYVTSQVEVRVFFEQESYLFAFYDQGFLKNQAWESPLGLGGGFSLRTNSGLFSFAMAVGKTQNIPFEFANMKVHFGYLSRF